MKKTKYLLSAAAALCFATAQATDIDLFVNTNTGGTNINNALFLLDNSANWVNQSEPITGFNGQHITKRDAIHEALYQVLKDPNNVNMLKLGIETYATQRGGKIIAAVNTLDTGYASTLRRKLYNATLWEPGRTFSTVGTYALPATWNSHYYKVIQAGTAGTTEPTWPTNGTTITDGTVVFQDMGVVYGTSLAKIPSYNNTNYATSLYEAMLYYNGYRPVWGTKDPDYDPAAICTSTGTANCPMTGIYATPSTTCLKNYIIYIANGSPDNSENPLAYDYLQNPKPDSSDPSGYVWLKGANPQIVLNPNKFQANWGDEMARTLRYPVNPGYVTGSPTSAKEQKNITTFVIDVYDPNTQSPTLTNQSAHAFLKSMALSGGGEYIVASSSQQIADALKKIIGMMKSTNAVYASTTLPVSVNVRGTNLNQVYMGVFRPDANLKPRWMGNLKMYQLGYDPTLQQVFLADKLGNRADSQDTGFIVPDAVSFWTHDTTPDYWNFSPGGPRGNPLSTSDTPDGDIVEKGGAGEYIRMLTSHVARTVLTCVGSCTTTTAFTDANASITPAMLGIDPTLSATNQATLQQQIIDFTRGDNAGDAPDPEWTYDPILNVYDGNYPNPLTATIPIYNTIRSTVHGDVLHSRPGVINYGGSEDNVVVYYGSNDGMFHALKGGKTGSSPAAGQELWDFIPYELLPNLKRMYDDVSMDQYHPDKPYFVDGTIGNLDWPYYDTNGVLTSTDHYIYLTMRRGGRFIYALKVNDLVVNSTGTASPGTLPTIAWKHTSADLPELGQTWSDPSIYMVPNGTTDASGNPVYVPALIIGAGYDPTAEDPDPTTTPMPAATMGRGIYVIDARTGAKIRFIGNPQFETDGGHPEVVDDIPSAVTVSSTLKTNISKTIQVAQTGYVGDAGGNVWKLYFTDPNPANWTMRKIAALGGTGTDDRKFLYQPDIVHRTLTTGPSYTAILLGSGDREHPHDMSVQNYFFMLKDYDDNTQDSWPITLSQLADVTNSSITDPYSQPGWKLTLDPSEKTVSSAITLNYVVYFNTHLPQSATLWTAACTPSLGEARAYAISMLNGSAAVGTDRYKVPPGGGFLPSPVPFTVNLTYIDPTTGQQITQPFTGTLSGTQVSTAAMPKLGKRGHQFWYMKGLDQ